MSSEEIGNITTRQFVEMKIRNTNIEMQLNTGTGITDRNEKKTQTKKNQKYVSKPELIKLKKAAHGAMGKRLSFFGEFVSNVTFRGQTKKRQ